jgi:hypothetical protein
MGDEHVVFFKGALIEQQFKPLARGQSAARMLPLDSGFAAAEIGLLAPMVQLFEDMSHRLQPLSARRDPRFGESMFINDTIGEADTRRKV